MRTSLNAGSVMMTLGYRRMASAALSVMTIFGPSYESGTHPYMWRATFWKTITRFSVEWCADGIRGDH